MPCSASKLYSSGIASPVQQKLHHLLRIPRTYLHVNGSCKPCESCTQNRPSVPQEHSTNVSHSTHLGVSPGSPLQCHVLSATDGTGDRKSHAPLLGLAARQPQWCVAPMHSTAGLMASHLHKLTPLPSPGLCVRAGHHYVQSPRKDAAHTMPGCWRPKADPDTCFVRDVCHIHLGA
jgi:hypothetical protein